MVYALRDTWNPFQKSIESTAENFDLVSGLFLFANAKLIVCVCIVEL